jgi:hypothetical protein
MTAGVQPTPRHDIPRPKHSQQHDAADDAADPTCGHRLVPTSPGAHVANHAAQEGAADAQQTSFPKNPTLWVPGWTVDPQVDRRSRLAVLDRVADEIGEQLVQPIAVRDLIN